MNQLKFFLTLITALIVAKSSAQIVNIPDPNFKNALINHDPVIDTNGDGEIQVSEAEAALTISVFDEGVTDITGAEAFVNLRNLRLSQNDISVIDPTVYPFLEQLVFTNNNVSSIDVSQSPNLQYLSCNNNPITSLDLTNNTNLLGLNAQITQLTSLDLSQNAQLEFARLHFTDITQIDLSNLPELKLFSMWSTDLVSLDVSNNPQLQVLDISGTEITTLDLSGNPNLEVLDVFGTNLTSLDISSNLLLERLLIDGLPLTELDASEHSNLQRLSLSGTNMIHLDVSNNPQLCRLDALAVSTLLSVNLQNGSNLLLDPIRDCRVDTQFAAYLIQAGIDFRDSNSLEFICVDDVDFAEQTFSKIPPGAQFVDDCSLSVPTVAALQVNLAPNPVSDTLRFSATQIVDELRVYTMSGSLVLTQQVNNRQGSLDLSQWAAGVYFVQMEGNGAVSTTQIIRR